MTSYTPSPTQKSYGDHTCIHCGELRGNHHKDGLCWTTDELYQRLERFQHPRLATNYERMVNVLQMVYRKHHLGDESIGWNDLDDIVMTILCEVMGDKAFQVWLWRYGPRAGHKEV